MVINFLHGRPACGKDTQADLLVDKVPNSKKISGVYRSAYTKKGGYSKYHELVEPFMLPLGEGINIPGQKVSEILSGIIKDEEAAGTTTLFICGLLRTTDHLREVDKLLSTQDGLVVNHVYIETSPERALKQTVDRFEKDAKEDGSRVDDELGLMQKRLDRFEEKVMPMLNVLKDSGRLITVNGEQDVDLVSQELMLSLYPQISSRESIVAIRT